MTLSGKQVQANLDCPNTHGLLELYEHLVPLFKHGLFVFELKFELSHQLFRPVIKQRTNVCSRTESAHKVRCKDCFDECMKNS